MPNHPPSRARRAFIAGLVLLMLAFTGMAVAARQYETDSWWVKHTYEVRVAIDHCIEDLLAEQKWTNLSAPQSDAAIIQTLTRDNPSQQRRSAELRRLLADPTTKLSDSYSILREMRAEEIALQDRRDTRARRSLDRIYLAMALSMAGALALLANAWRRVSDQLRSLINSETQTALLLERGADAVWALDRNYRVTRHNRRFEQIIDGIQGPGGFKRMMADEIGFARLPEWVAPYGRVFAGERVRFEMGRVLSGTMRHFLISIEPVTIDGVVVEAVAFGMDITRRKRTELKLAQRAEALHYVATADELTGVYNRRGFIELGEILLRDATEQGEIVLVLFADLDGLKAINDQQGHTAGDTAIKAAATVLSNSVRGSDLVGRFGGDEFVILAAGDDERSMIDRIESNLKVHSVKMSIGAITHDTNERARSLIDLLSEADALMYARKAERKKQALLSQSSDGGTS